MSYVDINIPRKKRRLYRIWRNMKSRCSNPCCDNYSRYGGRGIKVCPAWAKNYLSFEKWAIENGYNDSLTIDRINNFGNYRPENCRWVNAHNQNTNQRMRKDNKTGFVGVFKVGKRYSANIRINGKLFWLGRADTAIEACILRDKFILENGLAEYKTQVLKRD